MCEKEIWKDVLGYEGMYMVSNLGNVLSLKRKIPLILSKSLDNDGYELVSLCDKQRHKTGKVHRLVAEAFIPNPENLPIVNHKDENKRNNKADNLEWCTVLYNTNYGSTKQHMRDAKLGTKHTALHNLHIKQSWEKRKLNKKQFT